jgi:hypothetical protein
MISATPSQTSHCQAMNGHSSREPQHLPDPWLFDSEALLRELDRCRELILQIPITNPNATHFGIEIAVHAIWNLSQNLRDLLHLHREGQRAFRQQHETDLQEALSQPHTPNHDRQPQARRGNARRRSAENRVARVRTG